MKIAIWLGKENNILKKCKIYPFKAVDLKVITDIIKHLEQDGKITKTLL